MEKVTCLCPTYGRFSLLQDSLKCFIEQTWDNKKLLVLNDAPESFSCEEKGVEVINSEERFETLGRKRQALLEMADSKYVAQWDDDDVYLPWHLEEAMRRIESGKMVKPKRAFYIRGDKDGRLAWQGLTRNWLEAMTVFDREAAMALGGYTDKVSGQTIRMVNRFKNNNCYEEYDPNPAPSFIFRFADNHFHIQGGDKDEHERFARENTDFGDGNLTVGNLGEYEDLLKKKGRKHASDKERYDELVDVLV